MRPALMILLLPLGIVAGVVIVAWIVKGAINEAIGRGLGL